MNTKQEKDNIRHHAADVAQLLLTETEVKALEIKNEADKIALELVAHAKETARQMLLSTNLDTSKIPLICNKIVSIQKDVEWLKYLIMGALGGVMMILIKLFIIK